MSKVEIEKKEMTKEVSIVAVEEIKEVTKEAKNEEVKEIIPIEEKKTEDNEDIFITEENTFDVKVRYYKDKNSIKVEKVHDEYDPEHECKEFTVTFKYPSQGDVNTIGVYAKEDIQAQDFGVKNYQNIEFARLIILIRRWTLNKEVNNSNVIALHPDIIKGIEAGMREEIGSSGII